MARFGRDFGEVIKDYPTVSLPDDQMSDSLTLGTQWQAIDLSGASDGGYAMPVEYVKEAEQPRPVAIPTTQPPLIGESDYTELNWGRISFAIIEDRKFKTGPRESFRNRVLGPITFSANFDRKSVTFQGRLGDRQLKF